MCCGHAGGFSAVYAQFMRVGHIGVVLKMCRDAIYQKLSKYKLKKVT